MKWKRRIIILYKKERSPASRNRRNLWVFWRYKKKNRINRLRTSKMCLLQRRSIRMVSPRATSKAAKVGHGRPRFHLKSHNRTSKRIKQLLLSATLPVLTKSISMVRRKWRSHPQQKSHLANKLKAQLLQKWNKRRQEQPKKRQQITKATNLRWIRNNQRTKRNSLQHQQNILTFLMNQSSHPKLKVKWNPIIKTSIKGKNPSTPLTNS